MPQENLLNFGSDWKEILDFKLLIAQIETPMLKIQTFTIFVNKCFLIGNECF